MFLKDNKNYETITKNKFAFEEATLIALVKYAKISVVRISELEVLNLLYLLKFYFEL